MNNEIKQLCEQAKAYANESTKEFIGDEPVVWMDYYTEKFAELIVRECIAICKDTDGEDNTDARSGRQDCAVEIREHFGVEE